MFLSVLFNSSKLYKNTMARPRRFNFLNGDNPFVSYRDDEFAETFGFGKDNVNSIVDMVRDALEARIERRTVLSPENKVLIFLDYIRSNSLQRVLGKKRHSGGVLFLPGKIFKQL